MLLPALWSVDEYRVGVVTRRAASFDEAEPISALGGDASFVLYPDDISMFSDEERDAWRAELAARQARRRPPGFAAWPDEEQPGQLRIVS